MNAVITGGTKGIGRAIALKLAQSGYNIAVCARNLAELDELQKVLTQYGVRVLTVQANCAVKQELASFFEKVKLAMPTIDVLVNNVGVFIPGDILDEDDAVFEQQQALNLNTTYYLSKYIGRMMRTAGSGHIFNICSVASLTIMDAAGSYSVTKTAMLSLNHVLRKALATYGVKVTAILPGSTLTSSWDGTTIPSARFVQPEDIAQSIYSILNLSKGVNVDELLLTPLKFDS